MRACFALMGLVAIVSTPAYAWDGIFSGKIIHVEVDNANNAGFRVTLEGAPVMCGEGTAQWAYINKSHDNYEVMVTVMTSAWLSKIPVRLYVNRVNTTFCEIGYVRTL